MFKTVIAVATACAVLAAPAQSACWNAEEASAATVRELQSMLMVAALRCQVSGHAMMEDYNRFVVANRGAIGTINDKLKVHFIRSMGPVAGQRAYDSFTTSMANGYGAAASGGETCGAASSLAREAAMMSGSVEGLLLLADRQGLVARLPEGLCRDVGSMTVASAAPTGEMVRR
jgi:hypothetical protein